ncbi:hypothetical protein DIS24_g11379 [Lasiodiplodia hormozganensis]|uniref:Uncharacterized protein n=1 Tax=Lasiodiplodia hormozganensis TaxID=869390 RepID=A0AA40C1P4_9PEZI|nr:hypothetical protein DIS24_g11379 [Lasiodiplodia hormozganensis]
MPPSRKRKKSSARGQQVEEAANSGQITPPRPAKRTNDTSAQNLATAEAHRQRNIAHRYRKALNVWEHECEVQSMGDWGAQKRLQAALRFWQAAGCELCTAHGDYAAADDHAMKECTMWDDSPVARDLLKILQTVTYVKAAPKENVIDSYDWDEKSCKACGLPSSMCAAIPSRQPQDPTYANCHHIDVARRAVSALLAFEHGLLKESMWFDPWYTPSGPSWVNSGDSNDMQRWMSSQVETDRGYYPGFLKALDDLYGSYRHLLADQEYRAKLRPQKTRGLGAAALPPRCKGGSIEFAADRLNARISAKKKRKHTIYDQLDDMKGPGDDGQDDKEDEHDDGKETEQGDSDFEDSEYDYPQEMASKARELKSAGYILASELGFLHVLKPMHRRLTEIQHRLLRIRDVCMVCKAAGNPSGHSIHACVDETGRNAHEELLHAEKAIYCDRNLGCFRCGLPILICTRWEVLDHNKTERLDDFQTYQLLRLPGHCPFEGVVLEFIFGIKYGFEKIWDRWLNRLQAKGVRISLDGKDYMPNIIQYLGERKNDSGLGRDFSEGHGYSNLVWEFEWLSMEFEKESGSPSHST